MSHVVPSHGLRQRDPLSPNLVLLYTETLITLLSKASQENKLAGIKVCRGAPSINYLLFANDSVVFYKAEVEVTSTLKQILKVYENASEQCINFEKRAMVFSLNTSHRRHEKIMVLWSNGALQQYDKYLGLPPIVGRVKRKAFASIKDRVWQKLQTWKRKILSQGGKEILLKVVTLSTRSFSMSCFWLANSFCVKLERLMARFWWGQ